MRRAVSLGGGLFLLGASTLAVKGCSATESPYRYEVVSTPAPNEIVVRFPYGLERLHLAYVGSPALSDPASLVEESRRKLLEEVSKRVAIRFLPRHPLLWARDGSLEALVSREGSDKTVNEVLLGAGLGRFDASSPALEFAGLGNEGFDCQAAAQAAAATGIGCHGRPQPSPEVRPVTQELLAQAWARASELVGAVSDRDSLTAAVAVLESATQFGPTELAHTRPGAAVSVRDTFPIYPGESSIGDELTVILIHELVHVWQFAQGTVPQSESLASGVVDERRAYIEGHADYWSWRIAKDAGLADSWTHLGFGGGRYSEGFALWRTLYEWLESEGDGVSLRRGTSPRVLALHDALLGPNAPLEKWEREIMNSTADWCVEHLDGWPRPPWSVEFVRERLGNPQPVILVDWRITNTSRTRRLFIHLDTTQTQPQAFSHGEWKDEGRSGGEPKIDIVLEPGETYEPAVPKSDPSRMAYASTPLTSYLDPEDCRSFDKAQKLDAKGRWRVRLQLNGIAVSYGPNLKPIYFGRIDSPWHEVHVE
jgi:hypothetical protein